MAHPPFKPHDVFQAVVGDGPGHLSTSRPAASDEDTQVRHLAAQKACGLDDRVLPVPVFDRAMTDSGEASFPLYRDGYPLREHCRRIRAVQHDGNAVWLGAPLNVSLL